MNQTKFVALTIALVALAMTSSVVGYEHEDNSPVRGGVYIDNHGNFSLNVNYYIPMSSVEETEFNNKFLNQTILRARVLIRSQSEGKEYLWNVDFAGSGIAKDGRVILYSRVDQAGPDNDTYQIKEYKGTEVIETTPYLKW